MLNVSSDQEEYYRYNNTTSVAISAIDYPTNIIVMHQHVLSKKDAVEATCTNPGNIEYWICEDCGKIFSDADAHNEINLEETIIKALGHDYQEVPNSSVAATCEIAGKQADQKCSRCNDYIEGETIPAFGHDWGDWIIDTEATNTEPGRKHRVCNRDLNHVESAFINPTNIQAIIDSSEDPITGLVEDSEGNRYYLSNDVLDVDCTESLRNGTIDKLQDVHYDDWFINPVIYVVSHKNDDGTPLMKGYEGETSFGPADALTRGMFATILYRYENEPETVFDPNRFPDITNEKDFFAIPVIWASQMGYIKGYENGKFGATDNITREQLAVILFRYAQAKGYDTSVKGDLTKFIDANKINSWANESIIWANGVSIISGKENKADGTRYIDPQGNASRAECAAMLQRFIAYAEGQQK